MKILFLLIFLFLNFLYADCFDYYGGVQDGKTITYACKYNISSPPNDISYSLQGSSSTPISPYVRIDYFADGTVYSSTYYYSVSSDKCNGGYCLYHGFSKSVRNVLCSDGYIFDTSKNKCVSEPKCPAPFLSVTENGKTFCKLDSNLTASECKSKGFYYYDNIIVNQTSYYHLFPTGCYKQNILQSAFDDFGKKLATVGIFSSLGSVASYGLKDKIFNLGRGVLGNFFDWLKQKFSGTKDNLLNSDIKITDLKMSDNGVEPVVDITKKDNYPFIKVDDKGNLDFSDISSFNSPVTDNIPANKVDLTDNVLGAKDVLDTSYDFDDLLKSAKNVDKPVTSSLDLSSSYVSKSDKQSYPTQTVLTNIQDTSSQTIKKYKTTVTYPDHTKTHLDIVSTKFKDGSGSVLDVTVSNPLSDGSTFKKSYHIVKNSSGAVVTTTSDPAVVQSVDSSGHLVTKTNTASSVDLSKDTSSLDLTPLSNRLDILNDKVTDIDNNLKDMIDYKPDDYVNDDQSLKNFTNAMTSFDLNVSNYLNYLKNFANSFKNLKTQFDNTKKVLENKPVINPISAGQCTISVTYHSSLLKADPCSFIAPYRPILSIFFTLLGSLFVFSIAFKYLIVGSSEK